MTVEKAASPATVPASPRERYNAFIARHDIAWEFSMGALAIAWGSETPIRSRSEAVVLVDESAEQVPPANVARTDRDRDRDRSFGQRCSEGEGAMGALPVVVLGVRPQRPIEMPPTEDERPVEAFGPHRLDHALGMGVGVWRPEGRSDHPHPLRAEHRVEWPAELRVPVPDEEPDRAGPSVEAQRQVARLLGHPGRVRVRGRGAHMDPPAAKLDEHEDVERPEPDGLDGEEVAGDDALRLGPQELGPGRAAPSRGRPRPGRSEQGADRRRAHSEAELAKLALDPHAAPARVLAGEAEDECAELGIDRRPARATRSAEGPLPAYELAMPTEERCRGHEEGDPAVPWENPARRHEQDPVEGPKLRSARRPLQHPELMA